MLILLEYIFVKSIDFIGSNVFEVENVFIIYDIEGGKE